MNCYLCNNQEFIERPGIVRDAPELKIMECAHCGLVSFESLDHIDEYFYENSGMHSDDVLETDEWLRLLERDDARRIKYFSEKITNKDVLDFGCGPGGFLIKARPIAKSVFGIELETRLQPHYKANGFEVVPNIDDIPDSQKFDVITAFHVVEHLKEPDVILKQLQKKLKPSGQIIFEIPSASDALLTLYKNKPFSEFTYWSCHLFLFNSTNLKLLAQKTGMKLDYVDHVQRYPLSNHLHWLANGKPGGHQKWNFLNSEELNSAYEAKLAGLGITDTLIASFSF